MNLFRYIVICCLAICAIPNLVQAQYTKSEIPLTSYEDKTIDAILLKPSNIVVLLNSKKLGLEQIQSGGYAGYSYTTFQNSVVFQDQKPIILSKNESFIYRNVTENKLFTYEKSWNPNEILFRLYDLTNLKLSLIGNVIKSIPFSIRHNTKGNIVVLTDYDERFGRTIEIYSNDNFHEIIRIKPFGNIGFQGMMFFEDESFLYALFKPTSGNGFSKEAFKLFKFSLVTGEILNEKNLNLPLRINNFYVTDKYYIMYAYDKVIAYNHTGNQLWSRAITIKRGEVKADIQSGILYLGLKGKVAALDLSDGRTIWEKAYSDFYPNELLELPVNLPNIKIRPVFFELIGGNLVLVIGQTTSGGNNNPKYLTELFIINSFGNIVTHEAIKSTETSLLKCFFYDLNNFKIINDNVIMSYEK